MTPIRTLRPLAKVVLSTQSDERLVALCREGSEDAFAEIVRRHRPGLLRLARSLGTGDRADDVVQDGLVRAWKALQRSDGEIDLRPWLTTIVRNRALSSHSANRPTEELDETIDGVRQPGDIVIMREELRSAVSAVNSLPEAQREALVRSALSGESHENIASALATTPGAVRQLIFRARTGLREAVGALVPFPVVRVLADLGTGGAAIGGSAAGGAAVAASAGGASVALKALAIVIVGAGVAGSGIAIERHTSGAEAKETTSTEVSATGHGSDGGPTETVAPAPAGGGSADESARTPKSTDPVVETKSSTASRSETLVSGDSGSGTPRVADSNESDNSAASDSGHQTSDASTQPPPQQPHEGPQQTAPQGGQTGGQPHQGDDHHQQPPPPPPPPPPSGDTTGTSDGDGRHFGGDGYGGQQPQPTDGHDGNHFGADGLVDATLGD
jgi:RNA polymerase sigma factor (sigma-70 family)